MVGQVCNLPSISADCNPIPRQLVGGLEFGGLLCLMRVLVAGVDP